MWRPKSGQMVIAIALAIVASACGDGTGTSSSTSIDTDFSAVDFNGDGVVRLAVATDGPRDDGAYYQNLVDSVVEISAANGFEAPLVVDLIERANAGAELRTIAEQGVDFIAVGSSALSDPLPDLVKEFPDIFWYCNCGSGYPITDGLLITRDRGAELWLSGGFAAGLLLQESGGESAVFLGCCDLDFEKESFAAFVEGLEMVDAGFTATYVATGNFPFDFNNTAGATEALNNAVAQGADVVVPFLGGAHEPVVRVANESDLIVLAGGSSRACDRTDIHVDVQVKYDTGDYLETVFAELIAGSIDEGTVREFHVGVDDISGAEFCAEATPRQRSLLDDLNTQIGEGGFADLIAMIVANAYGE